MNSWNRPSKLLEMDTPWLDLTEVAMTSAVLLFMLYICKYRSNLLPVGLSGAQSSNPPRSRKSCKMDKSKTAQKVSPTNAKKNTVKLAEMFSKSTHFTRHEAESLLRIYSGLNNGKYEAKLDRAKFRDVLHNTFNITDDMLMDRVFKAFDRDNDGAVSREEWVIGLSTLLRGTFEEKMKYCFDVYDLNADGYISREEMFQILKTSLTKQPTEEDPDEGVKDLVEMTLKKMDFDHDSRLSFEDYKQAVLEEPLLLEAFGACLPDDKAVEAFLVTFSEKKPDAHISYLTGATDKHSETHGDAAKSA